MQNRIFFIRMSGDSSGNGCNESNQHRKEKRKYLRWGVLLGSIWQTHCSWSKPERVSPLRKTLQEVRHALKPVMALKTDLNSLFRRKIKQMHP